MEIAQIKKVKINVTNIKSVLIRSNKKLRNVEKQKSYLTRRQEEQEKRIILEKKIETPGKKIKIPLLGKAVGVARSIWDRLVNFFGYLLVGFVITRLPQIVENLKRRFAFIKPIWEGALKTFAIIGNGMNAMFTGISGLFNLRKSTSDLQKAESDLKNLDKELKDINRALGGKGSETGEESSTQQNQEPATINESPQMTNVGEPPQNNNLGSMNQVVNQELLKQDNRIQAKSKTFKEKRTREVLNPRLDSKLDRNVTVRRKTASSILNQQGPLDRDQPAGPNPDLVIVERTKRVWWNPTTWAGGGNNNNSATGGKSPKTNPYLYP